MAFYWMLMRLPYNFMKTVYHTCYFQETLGLGGLCRAREDSLFKLSYLSWPSSISTFYICWNFLIKIHTLFTFKRENISLNRLCELIFAYKKLQLNSIFLWSHNTCLFLFMGGGVGGSHKKRKARGEQSFDCNWAANIFAVCSKISISNSS